MKINEPPNKCQKTIPSNETGPILKAIKTNGLYNNQVIKNEIFGKVQNNPDEWKASRKSIWRLKQSIIPNDLLEDIANRIILPRKK
jgi:hypothetical protein